MHSVIVVVKMPIGPQSESLWEDFAKRVKEKLENEKGVVRLGENVWLLNLQLSVSALAVLAGHADQKKFPYGVLPFEREPQWLPDGFDPTPK